VASRYDEIAETSFREWIDSLSKMDFQTQVTVAIAQTQATNPDIEKRIVGSQPCMKNFGRAYSSLCSILGLLGICGRD
jgi:hypothetical protein